MPPTEAESAAFTKMLSLSAFTSTAPSAFAVPPIQALFLPRNTAAFAPTLTPAVPPPPKDSASSHMLLSVLEVTLISRLDFMLPSAWASTSCANTSATTVAPTPAVPPTLTAPAQLNSTASSAALTAMSPVPVRVPSILLYPATIVAFLASALITFLTTSVFTTPLPAPVDAAPTAMEARITRSLPVAPT